MTDFLKGSTFFVGSEIRAKIAAAPQLNRASVRHLGDGAYLGLEREDLRGFLDKYHGALRPYRVDTNDCDKFCAIVRGRILEACDKEDFPEVIFIAELCHWPTREGSSYHAALLVIDSTGTLLFYEPQTGELVELADRVRQADEIWG